MHAAHERPLSLNMGIPSLDSVESINAHSLQTSQSHVLVAWIVSRATAENNLIISVSSGSSQTGLELFLSPATLKLSFEMMIYFHKKV